MANEVPLQQARPQALDWAGHSPTLRGLKFLTPVIKEELNCDPQESPCCSNTSLVSKYDYFSIVIEIQLNFKNVEIITKRNNYSL